jgi:nucleoside-diphosphate-sugar epimerase
MKPIFVTGATGAVGRALVQQLADSEYSVTAMVRRAVDLPGCRTIVGTLEHASTLSTAVAACDAIVHLACSGSTREEEVLRQDIAGGMQLIGAWSRGPFLFASTSAVYQLQRAPITEGAPLNPTGWLARGKHVVELLLRLAERRNGRGPAALLRPTLILAPDHSRPDSVLHELLAQCRQGRRFLFEDETGLARYGCSYIGGGDFGRAIALSLAHDLSGPFNVAGGFCTWRELIDAINRAAGTRSDCLVRRGARPGAGEFQLPQSRTELDTTAFQHATGFQPRETLGEILEALIRNERAEQRAS